MQTCEDVCHVFFAPNQNQKTSHIGMTMAWKFFTVITLLNWGRRRALYCYTERDEEDDLVWLVVLQAPIRKDVTLPCMKATILEFRQLHASPAVQKAVLPCYSAPFFRFAWSFFLHCIFYVEQKRQAKKIYGKMRMNFFRLVHPALCFPSWIDRCDGCTGVATCCMAFLLDVFWSPWFCCLDSTWFAELLVWSPSPWLLHPMMKDVFFAAASSISQFPPKFGQNSLRFVSWLWPCPLRPCWCSSLCCWPLWWSMHVACEAPRKQNPWLKRSLRRR